MHGRLGPLGWFCSVLAGLIVVMSFQSSAPELKISDLEFLLARISLLSEVGSMLHKIATCKR